MPYLSNSQEWLHQSSLLIQARPRTTKITTKYTIRRPQKKKSRKTRTPSIEPGAVTDDTTTTTTSSTKKPSTSSAAVRAPEATTSAQAQQPPMADLVLKTYDPVSGACLKYRTDKAAEVGRLVASLGRLGREFGGLTTTTTTTVEGNQTAAVESTTAGSKDQGEEIPAERNVETGSSAGVTGGQKRDAVGTENKGEAKGGVGGKKRKKGKK
ncbi:MAG: hypothetical protein M1816_004882 [Peltula sp. TS41687]|nr:MAG: hypothetical protein M1816_004882 [Peltula sp. TS41687]